jgi:hypothetical protein
VEILLPFDPAAAAAPQLRLAPRSSERNLVLGIIDNNKDDVGRKFLDDIGREIVRAGFASDYFFLTKIGPSWTVTESEVAVVRARAHMVITGVGT